MANMEYCMFENTYKDLKQCGQALSEGKELSRTEEEYKNKLITLCRDFFEEFRYDDWEEDEEEDCGFGEIDIEY